MKRIGIIVLALSIFIAFAFTSCDTEPIHSYDAKYVALVDDKPVENLSSVKDAKKIVLLKSYTPENAIELSDVTVEVYDGDLEERGALELKAKVMSGNVTLKNINSKSITVDEGFTGTLTFDGGILEETTPGKEAFLVERDNEQATYVFKNMSIKTGTQKGIKIQSAKSITIENCSFDGSGLNPDSTGEEWETRSLSAIDITIEGEKQSENAKIIIKGCTFKNIERGNDYPYDTAGAIKIKSQVETRPIGSVEITGNTFENCVRDVVIGKADAGNKEFHKYTGDSSRWKIENNSSNRLESIEDVTILVWKSADSETAEKEAKIIGEVRGGCTVYDIAKAPRYTTSKV